MTENSKLRSYVFDIISHMCGSSNSEPGDGKCDKQVGEFTEGEQCTAENQAERSTDITRQSQ